jgi:hypothetical protein
MVLPVERLSAELVHDRAQGSLGRDEDQDQQGAEEYLASTLPQLVQFLNPYTQRGHAGSDEKGKLSPERVEHTGNSRLSRGRADKVCPKV